jgi:DNA processing protein
MDELTAWLTLMRAPSLHAGALRLVLQHLGSAAAMLAATQAELERAGAAKGLIDWLHAHRKRDLRADLRWLEQPGCGFLACNDERFPPLLAAAADAPLGLYVRGDSAALGAPQVALVGSRNPTPSGRENAIRFAAELTHCGLTITSGLAIGVDAASHRGALDAGGATIAVCGTGLDESYPRANAALAEEIAARGALVSEFPPGTPPLKGNFPRRNRIISGLSVGVLVIEAAARSGSLITARLAAEQGREVFAIPGSIHNELARGCHQLLRQGAKLVENAADILVEIRALVGALQQAPELRAAACGRKNSGAALDKEYEILLDALGFEPASVDALIARCGLGADAVASMLLILELEGRIETYPGGLYVQRAQAGALKAAK